MKFTRNDDYPPVFSLPEIIENQQKKVAPPRCALPLAEPLTERPMPPLVPKPYRIMRDIRNVSSFVHRNAAIDKNDVLWVWGATEKARVNEFGVLGAVSDDVEHIVDYVPKKVLDNADSVSVGHWHTLCVTKDRKLWSWGYNDYGELGTGNFIEQPEPVFIMDGVKRAYAFFGMSFAIMEDDSLWGWGNNEHFALQYENEVFKRPVFLFADVHAVNASLSCVLVIKKNGELWQWGEFGSGHHKRDIKYYMPPELFMEGIREAINIPTTWHGKGSMIIVAQNGDLYSHGYCYQNGGMCSSHVMKRAGNEPVKILTNVDHVYWGYNFSLVLQNNGCLYSSGRNTSGQLGRGKATGGFGSNKPQLVMRDVIEAAAGRFHGMALQSNGDLWIWGGAYGLPDELNSKS